MTPDPTNTNQELHEEKPSSKEKTTPVNPPKETTFLGYIREWADALVIAFVVAMFIRMFVVELFKIPSGSMSPTLLGDFVAHGTATDRRGEAHQYLLISDPMGEIIQVFQQEPDGYYDYQGKQSRMALTSSQQVLLQTQVRREEHRILVNKFAYWFSQPSRGDVVIFRVPFELDPKPYERNGIIHGGTEYHRDQSVYVKRAVAFGGERVTVGDDNRLLINGEPVTQPEILSKLQYISPDGYTDYDVEVPEDHLIVLGDNSDNSLDSRFWGPLPERNLRGKAIIRYWPFRNPWFISPR